MVFKGEDGQWVAECLSLPGCVSQGKTREEAVSQIREAIRLYIAVLQEDQLPIPDEQFDTLLVAVQASRRLWPRMRKSSGEGGLSFASPGRESYGATPRSTIWAGEWFLITRNWIGAPCERSSVAPELP